MSYYPTDDYRHIEDWHPLPWNGNRITHVLLGSHSSNGFRMANDTGYFSFLFSPAKSDILKYHWISNLEVIKTQREEILSL